MVKGNTYNWRLPCFEELKDLYKTGLSAIEISRQFNVTAGAVLNKLKRHNFKPRSMADGQALKANYITLSIKQVDFLNGLLLGDGSIILSPEKKSANYSHSDKNKSYLIWLNKYLPFVFYGIRKNGTAYSMSSKRYRGQLLELRNKWYPEGIKKIPNIELTPITLFNWYIGDGSYRKGTNGTKRGESVMLCNQQPEKERILLLTKLNILGIECTLNKFGFYIRAKSRKLFFEYILSHQYKVPSCYKYKFMKG